MAYNLLIVENNSGIRTMVESLLGRIYRQLVRNGQLKILGALGASALEIIAQNPKAANSKPGEGIDVVALFIPDKPGLEFLGNAKAITASQGTVYLAFTGGMSSMSDYAQRAMAEGAKEVSEKHITPGALAEVMAKYIPLSNKRK